MDTPHPFRSAHAKAEYHALYMERARSWPVASNTRLNETPSGQTFVRLSGDLVNWLEEVFAVQSWSPEGDLVSWAKLNAFRRNKNENTCTGNLCHPELG